MVTATQDKRMQEATPNIKTAKNSFAVRLAESVKASDQRFRPFLANRNACLDLYAGPHYCGQSASREYKPQPLNSIYAFISIVMPSLAGRKLAAMATSQDPELQWEAEKATLLLTWCLVEIRAAEALRAIVFDALFGFGVGKVSVDAAPPEGQVDYEDWLQDNGLPFWERVSPDEYILDPGAKKHSQRKFEGHYFDIPLADAMSDFAGEEAQRVLASMEIRRIQSRGGDRKAADMSRATVSGQIEELYPHVRCVELYLPREKKVVTIPAAMEAQTGFLAERDWDADSDPESGPYEVLNFFDLPDNVVGVSSIDQIRDLHDVLNSVLRKIRKEAEAYKTLLGYQLGKEQDVAAIQEGEHCAAVGMTDPNAAKEFKLGGVEPGAFSVVEALQQLQNRNGPNPDILGGTRANSKTLGQDQLLNQNANQRLDAMRETANEFASRSIAKMAFYLWRHPQLKKDLAYRMPGGYELPVKWLPEDERARDGDWSSYQYAIDPVASGSDNPEAMYARTMELLTGAVLPLAPFGQAQGTQVDVGAILGDLARLRRVDGVHRWLKAGPPLVGPGAQQQPGMGQQLDPNAPPTNMQRSPGGQMPGGGVDMGGMNEQPRPRVGQALTGE